MYVVFLAVSLTCYSPLNLSAKAGVSVRTPLTQQSAPGLWHFWHTGKYNHVLALQQTAVTISKLLYWHHCKGCLALAKWFAPNPSISGRWMKAQAFLLTKMPLVSPQPRHWPQRNRATDRSAHDTQVTAKQKSPLSRKHLSASSYCYFAFYFGSLPISVAGSTT